ncbi:tRNA pseudouridine(55) synthase TruB [Candidatus Profftia tarda]|uniref:tRNA pseudouridine synthase B n=1 Tax=Candidatus Profftia tarda TaxID=1177216 RepID=A0A8E4H467_9ENTR|nr:tRNA pseudouridine(55) synthase TruB [Candidatus Profftia tarda]CAD6510181.1 tRNA pseudouridine synthase B [Candidatus Profftia tarda]
MPRPIKYGRDVNGILLLDKQAHFSSNEMLQKIKRIYSANKAGHTGTLDPLAVGMLPICLGESTKFSQFLLGANKTYRVVARLGQRTNTSDANGEIIEERPINFSHIQLNNALKNLRGHIKQVPSMYSAIKYQGKPLYQYARQGIVVPLKPRDITIYTLDCIRCTKDTLELEIQCSKGTYIRTIIDDLGISLGCGAHVIYLRRLQVSSYYPEHMVTLEKLEKIVATAQKNYTEKNTILDSLLLPVETAVSHLSEINIGDITAAHLMQGQQVEIQGLTSKEMVRIYAGKERIFIGVGNVDHKGCLVPRRLLNSKYKMCERESRAHRG